MILVVKYGGNAMAGNSQDPVLAEIAGLVRAGHRIVLVHGGGPEIDRALAERSIESVRIEGQRATSAQALDVTEAVLCATLNKRLVRACLALGINAVGVSGEDGALLQADRMRTSSGADLGYVGEIVHVAPELLLTLLGAGFVPVVSPVAVAPDGSTAYNVNADASAGAIAAALRADAFVSITNVERVLRDPGDATSAIDRMDIHEARTFARSSGCQSSMLPKMESVIAAVSGGAKVAFICAARPGAIAAALAGEATQIVP